MKKIALLAAASVALFAQPASAQTVTGTITLTGSVAPKCLVVPGNGDTFSDSVDFGELAAADGTLRTGLDTEFDSTVKSFRVVCTSAAPTIAIDAEPLATATAAAAGYDNSIDYQATVDLTIVGGTAQFSNDSGAAALAATPIGGRLANNGSDNIVITASNFRTDNVTDLLVADPSYSGSITIVIAPGA